jgi:hypothetical protein
MPSRKVSKKSSRKGGSKKRSIKRRSSYGGSQLKRDLRSLEKLLGGYSSSGGKAEPTGRFFTVHKVDGKDAKVVLKGDTGRYEMTKSGGPLSAAKKAYTSMLHKLGLKAKGSSTELTFTLREITQDPNKRVGNPIYGPYEGFRQAVPEKLRDKFMKKHGIKHRATVHLVGKKNLKVGGSRKKSRKGGNIIAKTTKLITKTGKATIATGAKAIKVSSATLASALTPQGLSAAVATGALVAASRSRTSKKSKKSSKKRGGSSCGTKRRGGSCGKKHKTPKKGGSSRKRVVRRSRKKQMGGDFWSFFN